MVDLADVAERQEGLLRRSDLAGRGLHPRQLRRFVLECRLHELHPGVYALGHRALSRRAEFLAAVWWCGPGSALSHASAAAFKRWIKEDLEHPPPIHVSTTRNVRGRPGVVVHRTRHLDPRDVLRSGLLCLTDDERTLIDLADHLSYPELRKVADQLQSLPKARLIATAARLLRRAGAGRTHRLIHSEDAHTRSEMERRYVRYCSLHGFRIPAGATPASTASRSTAGEAAAKLVVELDSRAHHTRKREMEADRLRDRALKRHGVDTLRLVWHDLDPEDALAATDILQRLAPGA